MRAALLYEAEILLRGRFWKTGSARQEDKPPWGGASSSRLSAARLRGRSRRARNKAIASTGEDRALAACYFSVSPGAAA